MIDIMNEVVKNLKKELGIIEASITIPAIYLKRIIGQNHLNLYLLFII